MKQYSNWRDSLGLLAFWRRKPEVNKYESLDAALDGARAHLEAQGWPRHTEPWGKVKREPSENVVSIKKRGRA